MTLDLIRVMKLLGVKPKHLTCTRRAGFIFVVLLNLKIVAWHLLIVSYFFQREYNILLRFAGLHCNSGV